MLGTDAKRRHDPQERVAERLEPPSTAGTASVEEREDLGDAAMVVPDPDRPPILPALGELEPDPDRIPQLVDEIELAQRPEAVRLLAEAWGPLSPDHLRPLLDDPAGTIRCAAVAALDPSPEAVVELCRRLGDDLSAAVRVASLHALAAAPTKDQLWALSAALEDPQPEVRSAAVETLPAAGTPRAARWILAAAEDDDEGVRQVAYRRLVAGAPSLLWMAIARGTHLEELCSLLRAHSSAEWLTSLVVERMASPDPGDRTLALLVASRLDTPGWVDDAIDALRDPVVAVRRAAVEHLPLRLDVVQALVSALQGDPDPEVRKMAVTSLGRMESEDAQVAFVGALEDPDPEVQHLAVQALRRCCSPGLANRVAGSLTMANRHVLGRLLLTMGRTGENALVNAVFDGPGHRASAAVELLEETGRVTALLPRLQSVNPTERLQAVEALGPLACGDAVVADLLETVLSDPWPAIRRRAAFHLGRTDGIPGSEVPSAERDRSPEVLHAAVDALRQLSGQERRPDPGVDREAPAEAERVQTVGRDVSSMP